MKEKYGTLRAYYEGPATRVDVVIPSEGIIQMMKVDLGEQPKKTLWKRIGKLVDRAEADSGRLCHFRGGSGVLRQTDWWNTNCDEHQGTDWNDIWPRAK
ncbi:MAG TPA: hypothetical protein VF928_07295 [Usitatibacteraceae bacterium]